MQITWITRGVSDRLRIVVLGWAADPQMVTPDSGFDTVCIYDYREIESVIFEGYRELHLVAWSYGVWAAELIFKDCNFATATAINGTPLPMDDIFGIASRLFRLTVAGMDLGKFVKRMCIGMPEVVQIQRAEQECMDELRALAKHFEAPCAPRIVWTGAVIGERDMIFPPEAQKRYWAQTSTPTTIKPDMPHYPDVIYGFMVASQHIKL